MYHQPVWDSVPEGTVYPIKSHQRIINHHLLLVLPHQPDDLVYIHVYSTISAEHEERRLSGGLFPVAVWFAAA